MLAGSSVRISSVVCESADIGGSCIPFQTTVTYLGVHLDHTPSMKQHSSSLCLTTFLALRRIASIRPFLSNSSTEKLVASMITSRLGGMELRVGNNIIFIFFIFCCFSYGTCTGILYIVSCHNYIYYVCDT